MVSSKKFAKKTNFWRTIIYEGKEILKAAAYFHARLEQIHPFADGNGWVGRTLLNYYLMIRSHPPLVIFEEDKKAYYQALEVFDHNEELQPLLDFLFTQTLKTWNRNEKPCPSSNQ